MTMIILFSKKHNIIVTAVIFPNVECGFSVSSLVPGYNTCSSSSVVYHVIFHIYCEVYTPFILCFK